MLQDADAAGCGCCGMRMLRDADAGVASTKSPTDWSQGQHFLVGLYNTKHRATARTTSLRHEHDPEQCNVLS